jgi:hypothetical protein
MTALVKDQPRLRRVRGLDVGVRHPRVRHDLRQREALPRVELQHALDEVARLVGEENVPIPELLHEPAAHDQLEPLVGPARLVVGREAREHCERKRHDTCKMGRYGNKRQECKPSRCLQFLQ